MREHLAQPEFGQRLRSLRLARKWSQTELAGAVISTGYLSRLESGARPPTAKTVEYLAERLGVPESCFTPSSASALTVLLAEIVSGDGNPAHTMPLADRVRQHPTDDPAVRWQALWHLAETQGAAGDRAARLETLVDLVALSDEVDVPTLRLRARIALARCHGSVGDAISQHTVARQAFNIATSAQLSVWDTATALMPLISAEAELGRLTEAQAHADRLLELVTDGPATLLAKALWTRATVCIRLGDHVTAADLLDRALAQVDSHEDLTLWLRLRLAAASLSMQMLPTRRAEAEQFLDEIAPALALVGTPFQVTEFRLLNAFLAFDRGEIGRATEFYAGLEPDADHLTFRDRVRFRLLGCRLRIATGDRDIAVADARRLAQQAQEAGNVELAAEVWRTLAEALTAPEPARS